MKKNMLNKAIVAGLACIAVCGVALAGPHGGPHGGPRGGFRGGPHHFGPPRGGWHHGPGPGFRPPPPVFRHHHHSFWGRGGRHFWPGFVGGVVGGAVYNAIATDPVIVTTPTVVSTPAVVTTPTVVTTAPTVVAPVTTVQNVWVEGRYVDQVQGNGTVVRIWQPGHYEQRTVCVQ